MAFVLIGVVLVLLRWAEVGFFASWSWWVVLLPFALAVVWWAWSDATGLTQRRQMETLDEKRIARREKAVQALSRTPIKKKRR